MVGHSPEKALPRYGAKKSHGVPFLFTADFIQSPLPLSILHLDTAEAKKLH
jgi:hypothetical protein